MRIVLVVLIVVGLYPLGLAWRANRATSLGHALAWCIGAWLSWGAAFLLRDLESTRMEPMRFCALALTGCAGVAVLGARRPHVLAWDFVVLGLFAVIVLPLVETLFIGTDPFDPLRVFFLAATLGVGVLNYLPTRFGPAALLLLIVGAGEIALLYVPDSLTGLEPVLLFDGLLTTMPWISWLCARQGARERSEFDRLWLTFRDRWGLVWGQRVREQFNGAARNAGWPVKLCWQGLRREDASPLIAAEQEKIVATLRAALQRFLAADH
jgi:hypothetical protein